MPGTVSVRGAMSGRPAAGLLLLACVLGALVVGWRVEGGRWFVVATPSMGRAAPVGSLLLTRPAAVSAVHSGEIVTFRSPAGVVYSHRVVGRVDGELVTKGDINPAVDAWRIRQPQLVGRVVAALPGVGWLVRAVPPALVVLGSFWLLAGLVGRRWRVAVRLTGASLAASVSLLVLHPWVGLASLGTLESADRVGLRTVSTGLMPVRVRPVGTHEVGPSVRLVDGQVGVTWVRRETTGPTRVKVAATPDLTTGWWLGLGLVCLTPLGLALALGVRREPTGSDTGRNGGPGRRPGQETPHELARSLAPLVAIEVATQVATQVSTEVAADRLPRDAALDLVVRDAVEAACEAVLEPATALALDAVARIESDLERVAECACEAAATIAQELAAEVAAEVAAGVADDLATALLVEQDDLEELAA